MYCAYVFMRSVLHSWQIVMKLEFFRQIFEKFSNIELNENPYSGSRVVPCGRTDSHEKVNGRFYIYIHIHIKRNLLEEQANKLISTPEYIHMVTNRIHTNVLNTVGIKISCNGGRKAQLGQKTFKHNQLLI